MAAQPRRCQALPRDGRGVADDRLPGLADQWSHIEELSHHSDTQPEVMLSLR